MSDLLISDLAARSGVPASTLRYYEQVGLLPAARTPAGYRIYDQHSVERLRFISAAKHLHLSLDSIRALLAAWEAEPCRSVKTRLRPMIGSRLTEVEHGIAELADLGESLRVALRRLDGLPDRAEHCDPQCTFLADPIPADRTADEPAVACSLGTADHEQRLAQWRQLLASGVVEDAPGGVLATLPVAAATQLAGLIVAEQECCAFLQFRLVFTGSTLQLTISSTPQGAEFVRDLLPRGRLAS